MADITLTAALRSNLLSLQNTQKLLDTTQYRLATGKKVNTALDNASSFFASQSLSNRAKDLSALLDSQAQAVQVLKAADQGITSLTTLVNQAQAISQSAQSSLSTTAAVRSGDISTTLQSALGATYAGTLVLTNGGTATATITIAATDSLSSVAAAINASTGFTANIVDGSSGASAGAKRLEIRATGGVSLTLANSTGTPLTGFTTANGGTSAGLAGIRLDTGAALAAGTVAATSNTADSVALEKQYKAVFDQISQLITDTGYKGTNLLNGDTLNVQFNESNSSKIAVSGVTFNASGLGLSYAEQSQANGTGGRFQNAANITASLNQLSGALTSLRTAAQNFGNNLTIVQTRQDFTEGLVNVLKEGSDKLTLADKNEEGANLLSLQTSQQLGVTALSLASQASQSVLRLFG